MTISSAYLTFYSMLFYLADSLFHISIWEKSISWVKSNANDIFNVWRKCKFLVHQRQPRIELAQLLIKRHFIVSFFFLLIYFISLSIFWPRRSKYCICYKHIFRAHFEWMNKSMNCIIMKSYSKYYAFVVFS